MVKELGIRGTREKMFFFFLLYKSKRAFVLGQPPFKGSPWFVRNHTWIPTASSLPWSLIPTWFKLKRPTHMQPLRRRGNQPGHNVVQLSPCCNQGKTAMHIAKCNIITTHILSQCNIHIVCVLLPPPIIFYCHVPPYFIVATHVLQKPHALWKPMPCL